MAKQITELDVDLDEVALSLLGWEVSNLQARLTTKAYDKDDDERWHRLAASMELRFHPDDWQVRHTADKYLPSILWQLRSRTHGPLTARAWMTGPLYKKDLKAPKTISVKSESWTSNSKNPEDLFLAVTAVDWEDVGGGLDPVFDRRDFTIETVDYTTPRGISLHIDECVASMVKSPFSDAPDLEVSLVGRYRLGSAEDLFKPISESEGFYGDPDASIEEQASFEVTAPVVSVQVFDATGFLLDSAEGSDFNQVKIEKGGIVPARGPSYAFVSTFDVGDMPGEPARVVLRVEDPSE